jgi:aspartyl-tRNA(Asn)/glutamyl-tRNA(Gln) amidotransferase subunit A
MTRTVPDAALMLNVLALPDARDWHALPYDARDYRTHIEDGIRDLRIAWSPNLGYAKVDAEVLAVVSKAVRVFEELGAKVEAKDPGFGDAEPIFRTHWFSGAAFLLKDLSAEKRKLVDPGLLEVAKEGEKITTAQLLDAHMKRGALGTQMNLFHREYDLLVTPTLSVPAFDAGLNFPKTAKNESWTDWTPLTYPFNLTQQPAASIPCGFTKDGLPVGLQIVGPKYADDLVLRAARAFETARPIQLSAAAVGRA